MKIRNLDAHTLVLLGSGSLVYGQVSSPLVLVPPSQLSSPPGRIVRAFFLAAWKALELPERYAMRAYSLS